MTKPCECGACMGETPQDSRCRIASVPYYLRALVDDFWVMFGDGRSPLLDAPGWAVEMATLIEHVRAEKRAKDREQREQEELVRKAGLR